MEEEKRNFSVHIQSDIMDILKLIDMDQRSKAFREFYELFDERAKKSVLYCYKNKKFGSFVNTTINITKEQYSELKELKRKKVFTSMGEAVRFIFIYGTIEKQRRIVEKKLKEEEISKEKQEFLSKIISIEEYNKRKSLK